jgi:hypothetical protein
MLLSSALCLHAKSADLKFLNRVRNRIKKLLGPQVQIFEMGNTISHGKAKRALERATEGFVVVLVHGTSDYLKGGEYRSKMSSEICEVDRFLTRKDLSVFKGKVVFCMSCDSNGLAQSALNAGALAFVGFDEVPFNRFDASGEPVGSYVLKKHCQELIAEAVQTSLERFLTGKTTLDEAIDFLRLWISHKAVAYVRRNTSVKERREVAALFLRVKDGLRYHGPLGIRFKRRI